MATLDTRWKNPQGPDAQQMYLWAQDLIKELRKGDYFDAALEGGSGIANSGLADMAQSTIKGRAAGAGTGDPQDLTATQATAILNNFVGDSGSGGTKGLVPAPATGDATKFLRGDATWASAGALVLLTSGSLTNAADLPLPLTSYTAYRGIMFKLYTWMPQTDGVNLTCEMSTDGGANYLNSNYTYANSGVHDTPGFATAVGSNSTSIINISNSTASSQVGNASGEGISASIELFGWQATTVFPRIFFHCIYMSNGATARSHQMAGVGMNKVAQDCTALRFKFSSGNIASGDYAVYGFA